MSKKITGDDGKTYVQKKPFYKRVWFIILAIIVVIVIFSQMGSGNSDDSAKKVDSSSSKTDSSSSKAQSTFKVGETAEYKGVQFKVNKVDFTDGDPDVDSPDSGKQYVVMNITMTNNGDEKYEYNPYDFKLDDNGNQTDATEITSSVNDTLNSGTLAKGGSVTGNLVGQANTSNKLKLIYSGSIFSQKETITFDLN
ncbi:DUF4352 domain-containing protein [Leuconostoc mesenteroides]|uniref:DUF4352 domain-containing protein n=1 Tax=Leuconostoc mesenteroides TaxID=1245 RepID=UPI0022E6AF11|nr:DUF4352 domain-containing protein [Leuconostoc mesenteroides]